jgi:hypothetical protein
MIEKIIACAPSGPAMAALDIAIRLGLDHGGWSLDDCPVAAKYRLERLSGGSFRSIAEKAVGAAHGSLFFADGQHILSLRGETIQKIAMRRNKPFLMLNLDRERGFSASRRIAEWIVVHRVAVLHVDGEGDPRPAPSVASEVAQIMEASFFLSTMQTGITSPLNSVVQKERSPQREIPPASMEAAVNHLQQSLSLKDKATIANMAVDELVSLHFTLGDYINNHFDLFSANTDLLADCRRHSGQWDLGPESMAALIIHALWERLRDTCRIRIIK